MNERAGLTEVVVSWTLLVVFLVAAFVTYTRLPPGSTYHFRGTGLLDGGISRTVVHLNYPVSLAAIALVAMSVRRAGPGRRRLAALAIVLCAFTGVPGVVSQDDLTAGWANTTAAIGSLLALVLAVAAVRSAGGAEWARQWSTSDWARVALIAVLAVWSIPWMAASLGLYASSPPLFGHVFQGIQPTPGEPSLPCVHRGLHEGLAGMELAVVALLLSRGLHLLTGRARIALSLYLAVMLVYGVMVAAGDGWNEQLVKRGTIGHQLPNVLTPAASPGWLGLLLAALAVHLTWGGQIQRLRRKYQS